MIDIIHHAGLISEDLAGTISQYERLGFVFTPLSLAKITLKSGEDPVYIGLGNRNAIFERNYLEVVSIPDPEIWARFPVDRRGPFDIDKRLRLYDGLHIMHFGTDNLEAVRAHYVAQSQPISEIALLQRIVDTPDGQGLLQAKTIYFPLESNPEALIQVVQHLTPEYALQPRYMRHANGARRMTEIIVCSNAPEQLAAKYSRYTGHIGSRKGDLHVIDLGHSRVITVDPAGLNQLIPGFKPPVMPFLAGVTVATEDLGWARNVLVKQGVDFAELGGRLIVSPKDGCGAAVLFEGLDATR